MAAVRVIGLIWGALCAFSGSFWALQGAGIIMWPKESFMLADPKWTYIGATVAVTGMLLILLARAARR